MTADIALSLKLAISRRHINLTTPARCTVLRGKAFAIATHQNNPGTHPTVSPKSHISTGHPTSPRSGHCTYDNDKSRRHFPRNRMKEFPYARSLKTPASPIFRLQTQSVAPTVQTTSRRIQTDSNLIPLAKVLPQRVTEPVHHALPRIGPETRRALSSLILRIRPKLLQCRSVLRMR